MPDDSSGIYSLPAGTIVATGDTILPSQHNPWANDNANAMSNRFSKDGRAPATGNWNLNNFRITGLGTPVGSTDAVTKAYVDSVGGTAIVNKSGNYTVVAGDNGTNIRFTNAATATLTAAATLGVTFRCRIIASNGQVLIDPNGSETINGLLGLTLNTGQTAYLFCDGSNFVVYVTGDTALGPQLQGYIYGLTATTNAGTPATNIDVAAGATVSSASPFYLLQLASSITKNTNTAWAVGTGNGSLDTGSIANSTYYGYLIYRSDTNVADVLTSLSSTAPTMPANYDRRSSALFTFTRTAGVNSAPVAIGRGGINYASYVLNPNTASVLFAGIPAGAKRITAHFNGLNQSASSLLMVRLGVAGSVISSGYLTNVSQSSGASAIANASDATAVILATGNTTNANPAYGHIVFERLSPGLNLWSWRMADVFGSTTINGWASGFISLAGDVDRVQFTTQAGTALLNGYMNVSWEL